MVLGVLCNLWFLDSSLGFTNAFCALLERLQAGDLLVVPSLEALGSSYEAVLQAWKQVTGTGADIRVLDLPLLDTRQSAQVSGIVQQVLGFAAACRRRGSGRRSSAGSGLVVRVWSTRKSSSRRRRHSAKSRSPCRRH